MSEIPELEPWLRGTLAGLPAVQRAAIHALELAREDIARWCSDFTGEELNARPSGIAPIAFHVRHIARSIDRLLTYAEGKQLAPTQLATLETEIDSGAERDSLFAEFNEAIERAIERIRAIDATRLEERRRVGRKELPTSVGGLLVHVADHTQRHVGQAITTAKIVTAQRGDGHAGSTSC